ncbi:Ubiquitin carboxyl-terminal hydrolase 37 [Mortierella sp. AM989]|nr:Ubiquitin carboxyl-terminal hydrolase 37 [Mortierella sp. AM989]
MGFGNSISIRNCVQSKSNSRPSSDWTLPLTRTTNAKPYTTNSCTLKPDVIKPDPTAAYLTANDTPSDLMFNPFYVDPAAPSTPSKKRAIVQRPAAILEQTHKKTRMRHTNRTPESLHQTGDAYDQIMSGSPVMLSETPDRWRQFKTPTRRDVKEDDTMTPKKPSLNPQAFNSSDNPGRVTTLSPFSSMRPQFQSAIPSPRVLRSMSDRTRRYGRESGARKIKRLSSHEKSIVDSFSPYSKRQSVEVREETVSENVVKSTRGKLGDEDDAREFLNDTLNQVRREFRERNISSPCPLSRLFECNIDHTLVCMDCGNEIVQTEHYQDFCLELPACDNNRSSQRATSIGGLLPQVFDTQQIAFECEACQSESAMVHRSISKLPDILVVYLKRFTLRPPHGHSKDRSRVAIDGTLEFSQFCSPAAFSLDDSETTELIYQDEDQLHTHPHIPSDSPSSSGSLWFSSISPMGRDDAFGSSTSPTTDHDYIDVDLYESLGQGTASDPLLLNSDEEESYEVSASQTYSFYEPPSEDEQYQWAMEESLRASQTLSQESTNDGICSEERFQPDLSVTSINKKDDPIGSRNLTEKSRDEKSDRMNENNTRKEKDLSLSTSGIDIKDEKKKCSDKDDKDEDGDDEIKAAILASLIPEDSSTLGDQELRERESRELEEAIRRSLLDSEENKENISPEKYLGKKGQKGKRPSVLTRSCSQSQMTTIECSKSAPPRLLRANTVDVIAKSQSSKDDPFLSQQESQDDSVPATPIETNNRKLDESLSLNPDASNAESNLSSKEPKGKDKAHKKVQVGTQDHSMGLFQLQAMVSHTGLISSTPEGHYVCDGLGADGIWRCYDGGKRTKIGSISDLSQHRGRSGYLFFYVHCYSEDSFIQS